MNSTSNKTRENVVSSKDQQEVKKVDQAKHSKEFKEAAELGKRAYVEVVGLEESAETMGKVSEILSKDKEDYDSGSVGGRQAAKTFDPAQIRAQLLKNLPKEKEMRKQIEREIKKEIDYLHGKTMKMLRVSGKVNYFEMSNILKKIRELKGILVSLAKASMESLKSLWLRYVHGVM